MNAETLRSNAFITSQPNEKLSGNVIPGERGKRRNISCSSIFSANRDDIDVTQLQKQFEKNLNH